MRCENLSKRLNRYTILFLIMDLIILLIDLFSCHNHTKFLLLILTIFIINCLFFGLFRNMSDEIIPCL